MFRKSFYSLLIIAAFALAASAQITTGTVEKLKADGTRTPVAGVTVDAFRMDIKAATPPAKTDKNGQFAFAGLQVGWSYILSVSGSGVAPNFLANVRPGQEKLLITVVEGDGKRWSEDEAKKAFAAQKASGGTAGAANEAEVKAAQAKYDSDVKALNEKNSKAEKANEITARAIKEGKDAMEAKNYELAVAKYDEGIAADPDFVGSAPVFFLNRGIALTAFAVDTHNASIKAADATERVAAAGKVRKALADATDGFMKAWTILKNAPATEIPDKAAYDATKLNILRSASDVFKRAVETERVDPSVIDSAKILIPEYTSVETDAAKKAKANLYFADLYRVSGDFDNAVTAYKLILEKTPDDQDALAGAGLGLVNLGYIEMEAGKTEKNKAQEDSGKNKLQEGSNYLAKFVAVAPDTHRYKDDAKMVIDSLKKEQNVAPQKVAPAKKKP